MSSIQKNVWEQATVKLAPTGLVLFASIVVGSFYGNFRIGDFGHKTLALIDAAVFVIFATIFLHTLANVLRQLVTLHRLGTARAAAIQFMVRVIGYLVILFVTLSLLGISVERLLLGGAAVGIILSVAAQQALANFFASILLIISHPFAVGEDIVLNSGALGGKYAGTVLDIGLSHTRLKDKDGQVHYLPNATILSGAVISARKGQDQESQSD